MNSSSNFHKMNYQNFIISYNHYSYYDSNQYKYQNFHSLIYYYQNSFNQNIKYLNQIHQMRSYIINLLNLNILPILAKVRMCAKAILKFQNLNYAQILTFYASEKIFSHSKLYFINCILQLKIKYLDYNLIGYSFIQCEMAFSKLNIVLDNKKNNMYELTNLLSY